MTYVAAVLAVALLAGAATVAVRSRRTAYRDLVRDTVIVSLTAGAVFRGVLWSDSRELLVLRNAQMIHEGDPVPIDGEVVVDRRRIEFVQRVSA